MKIVEFQNIEDVKKVVLKVDMWKPIRGVEVALWTLSGVPAGRSFTCME